MKLQSNFALLDVMHGRKELIKRLNPGPSGYPSDGRRITVTITGYITHQHGDDDGTSIEFGVFVKSVQVETE